ncbi:deoxyuridine 5'-triphosphate nucleotidohydrolase [Acetobacter sp. DmW_043]|uniref:dUTP diphosphatase n=1 Tax=Acetobacter sp. DmW_043 TaxID=1670658 RepID=UPI000A3607C7|nr:dUTP diphosphatase [Acetobacter sp. DmW_043]OUI88949.1 deoxyuridine 5'-triphosphate nucleotidohydrolase [Acetobacter sp. DmW_043]
MSSLSPVVHALTVQIERLPHAQDLPLPGYATSGAAGLDLLAAVEKDVVLQPGERVLIPTGLKVALPAGYEMQVRPRSGLALKHGLVLPNSPGTIDQDYRGEIGIIMMNMGQEPYIVERGTRIAQAVVAPVMCVQWHEEKIVEQTERGAGGFGSTGTTSA